MYDAKSAICVCCLFGQHSFSIHSFFCLEKLHSKAFRSGQRTTINLDRFILKTNFGFVTKSNEMYCLSLRLTL